MRRRVLQSAIEGAGFSTLVILGLYVKRGAYDPAFAAKTFLVCFVLYNLASLLYFLLLRLVQRRGGE
jgi:hypothetical protein